MQVLVLDLKVGNIQSLLSALDFLGVNYIVSKDYIKLKESTHIILPGVSAFDTMIGNLNDYSLIEALNEQILIKQKPILGICAGMQILTSKSEEGKLLGLNLINGNINKLTFNKEKNYKVPNVGFNKIFNYEETGLFKHLGQASYFYFTHSYALMKINEKCNLALTNHSNKFISAFQKENICGVQFHPEKSQSSGLRILNNFFEFV